MPESMSDAGRRRRARRLPERRDVRRPGRTAADGATGGTGSAAGTPGPAPRSRAATDATCASMRRRGVGAGGCSRAEAGADRARQVAAAGRGRAGARSAARPARPARVSTDARSSSAARPRKSSWSWRRLCARMNSATSRSPKLSAAACRAREVRVARRARRACDRRRCPPARARRVDDLAQMLAEAHELETEALAAPTSADSATPRPGRRCRPRRTAWRSERRARDRASSRLHQLSRAASNASRARSARRRRRRCAARPRACADSSRRLRASWRASALIASRDDSSPRAASSVASSASASGAISFTPATPRSARMRRSTFAAVSRSPGRVVSSSSPAAMFAASVARNGACAGAAAAARPSACAVGARRGEARQLGGALRARADRRPATTLARSAAAIFRSSIAATSAPRERRVPPEEPSCIARPTRSTPAATSANAGSFAIVAVPRSARATRCMASASGPAEPPPSSNPSSCST